MKTLKKLSNLRRPECEKDVEKRLVNNCSQLGWYCRKFVSPGRRGVTDRIVGIPASGASTASIYFVELKAPGGVVSAIQQLEHDEMRALGMNVVVLYSRADVDTWCAEVANA